MTKEDSAVTNTDEPRSGSKGILSFVAAGLTLAVGITAWTWNSAVSNTAADPDEMSTAATSQLASDQASRSTATSSSSKATRSTSSPAPEQDGGSNGAPADPTEKIDALARGGNLAPLGNDPLLPPDTWRGGYQAPSPQQTIVEDAEPTDSSVPSQNSLPNQSQIPDIKLPPLPTEWPSTLPGVPGKPPTTNNPKPSNPTTPKPSVPDDKPTKPGGGEVDPGQQPDRPNAGSSDSGQGGTPAPSTKPGNGTKADGEGAEKKGDSQPEVAPTPDPKPRPQR
ncbi:hypothetical protein cu0477 [Corynebacterium urealyticum DSM 7109]|uniref:Uncharacterized protein n=2 Tax=Corynebacterium urealyticum TaxID=43771 RepID=B1VF98_CORU7|nr:hypothetical protein cu0477 [Corynebacterium urealyticum DSM 7109]